MGSDGECGERSPAGEGEDAGRTPAGKVPRKQDAAESSPVPDPVVAPAEVAEPPAAIPESRLPRPRIGVVWPDTDPDNHSAPVSAYRWGVVEWDGRLPGMTDGGSCETELAAVDEIARRGNVQLFARSVFPSMAELSDHFRGTRFLTSEKPTKTSAKPKRAKESSPDALRIGLVWPGSRRRGMKFQWCIAGWNGVAPEGLDLGDCATKAEAVAYLRGHGVEQVFACGGYPETEDVLSHFLGVARFKELPAARSPGAT